MKKYEKVEILIIQFEAYKDVLNASNGGFKEDGTDITPDFWV